MQPPRADEPAPVVVQDLVKRFDDREILSGVNLTVPRGQTMVILGGSGSGKSTLLRCMIGSIPPSSGRVTLFGQDISSLSEDRLNEVRKRIGILFQSGALFNSMTLRENVALPLEEHTDLNRQTIEIIVKIKLELVGLREHAEKYPAQISGGMKKRAGLARALALDPQVLFYDEPSAGLDPVTSAQIDQLILSLTRQLGVTSVVVTHEMDSAFTIADRVAMIDKGVILKEGPLEDFARLREAGGELEPREALIRQFLRGEAEGPITQRREGTGYAEDLLGPPPAPQRPSLQATRRAAGES